MVPRYPLVDAQENLFIGNAARPSDGETLTKQIESLITHKEKVFGWKSSFNQRHKGSKHQEEIIRQIAH